MVFSSWEYLRFDVSSDLSSSPHEFSSSSLTTVSSRVRHTLLRRSSAALHVFVLLRQRHHFFEFERTNERTNERKK